MDLKSFKTLQRGHAGITHLNNAGMTPVLPAARKAADEVYAWQETFGATEFLKNLEVFESNRDAVAKFLNAPRDGLAWQASCAMGLSQVAFGLQYKPDAEIVVIDQEYPSSIYPWMAISRQKNLKLKKIMSRPDFSVSFDEVLSAITPRTKVVAVSWVQYQTGVTAPLAELATACQRVGAWLVVDAIQGVGVIPFDFTASGADAVVGGGHKWLCGPLGTGYLAMKPERVAELTPIIHGASTYGVIGDPVHEEMAAQKTAARFEGGCPSFSGAAAIAASCRELQAIGITTIHQEAMRLAGILSENLEAAGYEVLRSKGTASPIVTFRSGSKAMDLANTFKNLTEKKVSFAPRAGGIRLSPHAFNTEQDIECVMNLLK